MVKSLLGRIFRRWTVDSRRHQRSVEKIRSSPIIILGHNPANRFELTKGRDLIVDPEPASDPINFLAYPLLEMNGNVVRPETSFSFRRTRA